jgi:hypothetical protein
MKYEIGLILEHNSSYCKKIFSLQKKIVTIVVSAKLRNSCRCLFKGLHTLPLPCKHIFSLMNFTVITKKNFFTNSAVHSINTRKKYNLVRLAASLSSFEKSAYHAGIKIFNSLSWKL